MKIYSYIYLIILVLFTSLSLHAQNDDEDCNIGLDIHIANDVSGSVDAEEFEQSKNFIGELGLSFSNSLGLEDTETRISISSWSGVGEYEDYDFPIAGPNFTTEVSDIVNYTSSPKPFSGSTDLSGALISAFNSIIENPIPGRNVPKVIIILTDASCGQISPNIVNTATQIKNQGVTIILLAVDASATCDILTGTNVASPNGYFSADSYAELQNNAISLIQSITQVGCEADPPDLSNAFDLTINLTNYELTNCNPGPPIGVVDFTITNNDFLNDFSDILKISFYDGDPTLPGTQFLFTENLGTQNIPSNGGTFTASISNQIFLSATELYAVVNFDGSIPGNQVPLLFSNLPNQVEIDTEEEVANNISNPINRIDEGDCSEFAYIDVQVTNLGVGCDSQVFYTVEVCNIGTGNAIMGVSDINHIPPDGFNLVSISTIGDSPFIIDNAIGPEQIVSENENTDLRDIYAADIDGDGDMDVLSANITDEKLAWYANDGTGNFGAQQPIASNIGTGRIILVADIDNDGDIDVISGGDFPNEISWFENDGAGNFISQQIISSALNLPEDIRTADVDGDGDLDVLVAFFDDDTVAWYENDGAGNFGSQQIISSNADGAMSLAVGDIDTDGDLDVVSISSEDDKIAWYANDGTGNFGAEQFITVSQSTDEEVYIADINGNSLMDIVATGANQITWLENDGNGNFNPEVVISNAVSSAQSIFPADYDNDGDIDILSSSGTFTAQSKISWFENDGNGNFGAGQFITESINNPQSVFLADFDGDGDLDVLSFSTSEDKIIWYENLVVTKLPAQTCFTQQLVYDISDMPPGDYDYSVGITAIADDGIAPFVVITPNTDFTVGNQTGLDGYDGTANTSDDLSFNGSSSDCVPGEQVVVDVSLTGDGSCPGDFSEATITINNQSGLTFNNTILTLDLSGTGSLFNGEPYNLTNGLALAEPNIFDPAYPNVANALSQQSGANSIAIFNLAGGISTFNVDIMLGTGVTTLSAEVSQIPNTVNNTGNAIGFDNVTAGQIPIITGNCPTNVTINDTNIVLNFSVSNAITINWTSGSGGNFTNPSTASTSYIINDVDKANGLVNLLLEAESSSGCAEFFNCQVNITGGIFDYGDAPISYDLNENSLLLPLEHLLTLMCTLDRFYQVMNSLINPQQTLLVTVMKRMLFLCFYTHLLQLVELLQLMLV
ncbi:FG-GAP-like repeat-containing protein [Flavobacterium sp. CS20]|uniref:FG-GAP-like repeat-containing protein n=1 Tax=Flavobacterium sp. CS20 TaxID=2775246 RepID=UPI001B39FBD7|nr:FG-GAP-like repeat-containing protein [Flavobacterium sp. CS20]QTY28006.1 VCBS repeat-containing protein [Flavobacterium sp. CS20]